MATDRARSRRLPKPLVRWLRERLATPSPVDGFIFGMVLVWLYAAVLVWFVGYCAANVSNVMYGFRPMSLTIVGTA